MVRVWFEPDYARLGVTLDLVSLYGSTPVPHHVDLALELDNAVDFDFTYPIRQAALWFIGLFGSCVLFMGCCAAGLGNRRRR